MRKSYFHQIAVLAVSLFAFQFLNPQTTQAGICGVLSTGFCTSDSQCRSDASDTDFFCNKDLPQNGGSVGVCDSYSGQCSDVALQCGWKCGIRDGGTDFGYPGLPGSGVGTGSQNWTSDSNSGLICTHMYSDWSYYEMETGAHEWRPWGNRFDYDAGDPPNYGDDDNAPSCPNNGFTNTRAMPLPQYLGGTGYGSGQCTDEVNNMMTLDGYAYTGNYNVADPDGWHRLNDSNAFQLCRTMIDNSSGGTCDSGVADSQPSQAHLEDKARVDVVWNGGSTVDQTVFVTSDEDIFYFSDVNGTRLVDPNDNQFEDIDFAYFTYGIGNQLGSVNITIDGSVDSFLSSDTCPTQVFPLEVVNPPAWWQAIGAGDVVAQGNIESQIPNGCTNREPNCKDELIVEDPSTNSPGVVIYGTSAKFKPNSSITLSEGKANVNNWVANTGVSSFTTQYDYSHFEAIANGKSVLKHFDASMPPFRLNPSVINSASEDSDGYSWVKVSGDISTSNGNLNFSNKKAIILVDGDLYVEGDIILGGNIDNTFIMFVVRGDIIVDHTVDQVEGVYLADGYFRSDSHPTADDDPLAVYGMVTALAGFELNRDLGDENIGTPAETFEFAPELLVTFPAAVSDKSLAWREVVP